MAKRYVKQGQVQFGDTQHLGRDSRNLATFHQSNSFHLEFQRVPRPSFRFTQFYLLKLIFTHQPKSTFFRGKVNMRRQF